MRWTLKFGLRAMAAGEVVHTRQCYLDRHGSASLTVCSISGVCRFATTGEPSCGWRGVCANQRVPGMNQVLRI
jgi:hypothetical protein